MSKRINAKKFVSILLAFVMVLALVPGLEAEAAGEKEIVIYHTNDIHGRGIGDPATEENKDGETVPREEGIIGYARYKTILDKARADEENMLVLDAGDTLHGLNFVNISNGKNAIKLMNAVGTDAMVLGNHEFNYGPSELDETIKSADFEVLGANINKKGTDETVYQERVIKELDGVKIGIFGIVTPETKVKAHPNNTEGLDFALTVEENAKIAQEQIDALKEEGADVIIGLFHVGVDQESEVKTTDIAEKLTGVDIIIDGHSHTELPDGLLVNDILIAQTGDHFGNIGKVTFTYEDEGVDDRKAEFITFADARDVEENPEIVKMIEDMEAANAERLDVVVGNTTVQLDGERNQVRTGETNLGNLITDAMVAKDKRVDVALMNGGGIRASIDEGEITYGEVLTVLPFGNQMTVIEVTGQTIVDALTFGVDAYPESAGKFPHVSGMTYQIYQGPNGKQIYNLEVNGEPIDLDKTYNLATNDFMAVGGDGYEMFKGAHQVALYASLEEIVVEYIQEFETIIPEVEGRITELEEVSESDILYASEYGAEENENRIAGDNRIETSIEVAKAAFPEGAETVVLANDINSVDALTVAPLADLLDAPVILNGSESLNENVAKAIEELGGEKVVLVGGENSLSEKVEADLEGKEVERIAGDDRFETAAKIGEKVVELSESKEIILANARQFADALSAANLATRKDAPILLVEQDSIPEVTKAALEGAEKVYIVGGPAAISEAVEKSIDAETKRLAGDNRYGTSVEVAKEVAPDAKDYVFAQGVVSVDALTVGPNLGDANKVLLLVGEDFVPQEVADYLAEKAVEGVTIIGGENTINMEVELELEKIAG